MGRLCTWDNLFPERELSRSRYERVLIRAISGQQAVDARAPLHAHAACAAGPRSIFRRDDDRSRHIFGIDYLLNHLRDWERPVERGG